MKTDDIPALIELTAGLFRDRQETHANATEAATAIGKVAGKLSSDLHSVPFAMLEAALPLVLSQKEPHDEPRTVAQVADAVANAARSLWESFVRAAGDKHTEDSASAGRLGSSADERALARREVEG